MNIKLRTFPFAAASIALMFSGCVDKEELEREKAADLQLAQQFHEMVGKAASACAAYHDKGTSINELMQHGFTNDVVRITWQNKVDVRITRDSGCMIIARVSRTSSGRRVLAQALDALQAVGYNKIPTQDRSRRIFLAKGTKNITVEGHIIQHRQGAFYLDAVITSTRAYN